MTAPSVPAQFARRLWTLVRPPHGGAVAGAVDGLADGCLTAWVRPPAGRAGIALTLERPDAAPVALARSGARADRAGAMGFVLADVADDVLLQLLAGEATVRCVAAGTGVADAVPLTQGFRDAALSRLKARLAGPAMPAVPKPAAIWDMVLQPTPARLPADARTVRFDLLEGLVSRDETTIVGRDGFLFLYRGHNRLLDQYRPGPLDTQRAEQWLRVIQERRRIVTADGATFLQILIPEKTSTLSHLFPLPVDTPTHLSRRLREAVAASGLPDFMDVASLIPADAGADWWRRTDSHMSTLGSLSIFQAVLRHLGYEPPEVRLDRRVVLRGDLGDRFPGLVDIGFNPPAEGPWAVQPKIASHRAGPGNSGSVIVSHNPDAPVQKTLFVCGNSYFGTNAGPQHMTWWFARWFRDFHFHWKSELDVEACRAARPDHVICQTIERFLPQVPQR